MVSITKAFEEIVLQALRQKAADIKAAIEYEFSVEYGEILIGEPQVTKEKISFDLSSLSAHEKELLETLYYQNATKRIAKGSGKNVE